MSDYACGSVDYALSCVEYTHHDVPCVCYDDNGTSRFENPLEKHPSVHITVHIVFVRDHLNKLYCHNERQNHACYGDYDVIRKVSYHVVDRAIPRLRGRTDLTCNITDLLIYAVEHTGEIADDTANQDLFQPFSNRIEYHTHRR